MRILPLPLAHQLPLSYPLLLLIILPLIPIPLIPTMILVVPLPLNNPHHLLYNPLVIAL